MSQQPVLFVTMNGQILARDIREFCLCKFDVLIGDIKLLITEFAKGLDR